MLKWGVIQAWNGSKLNPNGKSRPNISEEIHTRSRLLNKPVFTFVAFIVYLAATQSIVIAAAEEKPQPQHGPNVDLARPAMYRAKEANLPDWARQGAFCYMRLDGGPDEAAKAKITGWGLSQANLDVLATLYDQRLEQIVSLLKEARFNWIWITYSTGFSNEHETEQRRQCRRLIERCHAEGIRVCAYMSLTNMFWRDMFEHEPESKKWVSMAGGKPRLYSGCPERYLANINHPGWRAYVKHRVELALEDNVDAIFYDNMWAEPVGMRSLLSEVQDRLVERARETGKPKVLLMVNAKETPQRIDMHDICEMFWAEYGQGIPGVWKGNWYVDNARKTRYAKGNSPSWKPLAFDLSVFHKGDRMTGVLAPRETQRSFAEAVAFGGSLCRCIEGRMIERLVAGQADAVASWRALGQYNAFALKHQDLYVGAQPDTRVLLLGGFRCESGSYVVAPQRAI